MCTELQPQQEVEAQMKLTEKMDSGGAVGFRSCLSSGRGGTRKLCQSENTKRSRSRAGKAYAYANQDKSGFKLGALTAFFPFRKVMRAIFTKRKRAGWFFG